MVSRESLRFWCAINCVSNPVMDGLRLVLACVQLWTLAGVLNLGPSLKDHGTVLSENKLV